MPDVPDKTQNELRSAQARRLRDFLRDDASGLYQKFWESMTARWSSKPLDVSEQNDRQISASLLSDMIEQGVSSPPRPKAAGGARSITRPRSTSPAQVRTRPLATLETTEGEAEPNIDHSTIEPWPATTGGIGVPPMNVTAGTVALQAPSSNTASVFAPGDRSFAMPRLTSGLFDLQTDDLSAPLSGGGIFGPPTTRNDEPVSTLDAELLAPPPTAEQKAMTAASRRTLSTIARWLGESTASAAPAAFGGDAALARFSSDVLRICDLLEALRTGGASSARQSIETARQVSRLFYDGVYERWRGAALGGRFRLGEIGRAADELKQSLSAEPSLTGRVYIEHGAPAYDSYRHELSPNTPRPPDRVLPISFGIAAASPDEQAWRVLVRPFDQNLVQLEGAG